MHSQRRFHELLSTWANPIYVHIHTHTHIYICTYVRIYNVHVYITVRPHVEFASYRYVPPISNVLHSRPVQALLARCLRLELYICIYMYIYIYLYPAVSIYIYSIHYIYIHDIYIHTHSRYIVYILSINLCKNIRFLLTYSFPNRYAPPLSAVLHSRPVQILLARCVRLELDIYIYIYI